LAEVTPVRLEPSIAGKAPVRLAEVKDVRLEPSIAGKAPVRLAEVKDVRLEPSIAGKAPVRLADVRLVIAEPLPDTPLGKLGDPVPAASEIESTFIVLMVIPPV